MLASGAGTAAKSFFGVPFETSGATAMASPNSIGPIQVSAPAANGYVRRGTNARMKTSPSGAMVVTHREYVSDITPASVSNANAFQLLISENINPGNPLVFPWLSSIATRYESYLFRNLRFIYEPQCPTTVSGTVSLAVDYDALDDPPLTKLQMMSYKGAVRSPPWFASNYQCASSDLRKQKSYFVRNGAQLPSGDPRLYDVGNVYVAYEGPANESVANGELYVEYSVELTTPNLQPYALSGTVESQVSSGGLSLGTPGTVTSAGPLQITAAWSANDYLLSPAVPGTYWVSLRVQLTPSSSSTDGIVVSVPTGDNTTIGTNYRTIVASTSANQLLQWFGAVNFTTASDQIQITTTLGITVDTVASVIAVFTPLSQETFNFPASSELSVIPNALISKASRDRGMKIVHSTGRKKTTEEQDRHELDMELLIRKVLKTLQIAPPPSRQSSRKSQNLIDSD